MRLHASRVATIALLAIHGLAIFSIAVSPFELLAVKGLSLVVVTCSAIHGLRTHAFRFGRAAVVALTLRDGGRQELEYGDGASSAAMRIEPAGSVALHWLVVLRLRHEQRRQWLPLLPDAMDPEDFRRLQLWLRRHRPAEAAGNTGP